MSLDIKKIYVDSRFRTSDSKSNSDFTIDLPRNFNVPDDTVCYIDDIVLPVSWATIDYRNRYVYFSVFYDDQTWIRYDPLPTKNYNGASFASALQTLMNTTAFDLDVSFTVTYDFTNNVLQLSVSDDRAVITDEVKVTFFPDATLAAGLNGTRYNPSRSVNEILSINNDYEVKVGQSFYAYLDLHSTRNLYLQSSALASYDTVSNFGNDTIIKKIPVRANFNEVIFDNASEGFDYLTVSRRTLRHIDFRLVDTQNNIIDMRGTHWSFSIVFQKIG